MTTYLELAGMTCHRCVRALRDGLLALPGVLSAEVDIGRAVVSGDAELSTGSVLRLLHAEGFQILRFTDRAR